MLLFFRNGFLRNKLGCEGMRGREIVLKNGIVSVMIKVERIKMVLIIIEIFLDFIFFDEEGKSFFRFSKIGVSVKGYFVIGVII